MASNILKRAEHALKSEIVKRVTADRSADLFVGQLNRTNSPSVRLNLILPTIASQNIFGGISTALRFFNALAPTFEDLRIIVMGDRANSFEQNNWPDWTIEHAQNEGSGKTVFFLERSNRKVIDVRRNDIFLATEWQTAYLARDLIKQQRDSYGHSAKLIYLLQDFEPSFHPWSSRFLLSSSTYSPANETIAVFNTSLLQAYFHNQGYAFPHEFRFEPRINPKLKGFLDENSASEKGKVLVVYGRPHNLRNAFALLSLGLQNWASRYAGSAAWRVISMGADHAPIELPNGHSVQATGKLSLSAYANTLAKASVGVSLMVSPHPSYPPLEMAAFGLKVITNHFPPKNLSLYHPDITSLETVTPEILGAAIQEKCELFEQVGANFPGQAFTNYQFCDDTPEFDFCDEIRSCLGL